MNDTINFYSQQDSKKLKNLKCAEKLQCPQQTEKHQNHVKRVDWNKEETLIPASN